MYNTGQYMCNTRQYTHKGNTCIQYDATSCPDIHNTVFNVVIYIYTYIYIYELCFLNRGSTFCLRG